MNGRIKRLRWLARLLGTAPAIFGWVMMIGEAFTEPAPNREGVLVLVALIALTMSAIAAWRWQRIGGAAEIVCAVAFGFLVYLTAGHNRLLVATLLPLPWFVSGVLFLTIDWVARRRSAAL